MELVPENGQIRATSMIVEHIQTEHVGKNQTGTEHIVISFSFFSFLLGIKNAFILSPCLTLDLTNEKQDKQHRHPTTKLNCGDGKKANSAEL